MGGHLCNFSLKSKSSFDFTFSLYLSHWDEGRRDKFLHFFSSSRFFSSSPFSSSSNSPLLEFSTALIFSCFQGDFLEFLHLFSCVLWMIVDESCSKPLGMLYCHEFMFICCGISRGRSCFLVYMKEVRSAENRTPRVRLNSEFSGCNTDVFAFLWYF